MTKMNGGGSDESGESTDAPLIDWNDASIKK